MRCSEAMNMSPENLNVRLTREIAGGTPSCPLVHSSRFGVPVPNHLPVHDVELPVRPFLRRTERQQTGLSPRVPDQALGHRLTIHLRLGENQCEREIPPGRNTRTIHQPAFPSSRIH